MKFLDALKQQIIVLDGAMGTMIQNLNLGYEDFGGQSFQMLSDMLSFSRPQELKKIHKAYYMAGAHAVETNTFGASPLRLSEYDFSTLDTKAFDPLPYKIDLPSLSYEKMSYYMNKVSCEIAKQALYEYSQTSEYDGRPLYVIGSIGPSNYVLSSTKADLKKGTWEQIENNFYHQVLGLIDGKADVLLYETQQDILELKAAISGGIKAMDQRGVKLPIMAQVTVNEFAKMQIFNTDIHAALTTIQDIGIDVFGINCSIGPDLMKPAIEILSKFSKKPISVLPNAGMPVSENGFTVYKLTPDHLVDQVVEFVSKYGVNIVGGCCGTTPEHIKLLAQKVKNLKPKQRKLDQSVYISGPQNPVKLSDSDQLILIGERLNVRGSKKVREAVENSKSIDKDTLESVVNEMVDDLGLSIIDVCMDSNLVDTIKTLPQVVQVITTDFKGAISLDSFDADALIQAIKVYPGRPIVNSISMEEYAPGITKVEALVPATKFHNPVYIALATGPEGPAVTAAGKVYIAKQVIEACAQYKVMPDQIFFDINAFPIGSESDEDMNFALESLNSIPQIKALHPDIKTTIGVGNLTNGLAKKPYMRVVLTSIFLDEARKRGLNAAIVNPNHYVPVESLDKQDYELGLKIVMNRDMDAFEKLEQIAEGKVGKKTVKKKNYDDLLPEIAICEKIKNGFKEKEKGSLTLDGITFHYDDAIVKQAAQAIIKIPGLTLINDYLMQAMKSLGDKFAAGEVSLPHLLKSADVMKHVMGFIESYMTHNSSDNTTEKLYKGTISLGTVYQDVHSIGKDLTKTLFENYGYRVIDLGAQVPLEKFIETAKSENADAIGLSALLVQTSNHMITVAKMMKEHNLNIPLLIGGAPVNTRHAAYVAMHGQDNIDNIKPDVFYCNSAMDGINVMESLFSENKINNIEKNKSKLCQAYLKSIGQNITDTQLLETLPKVQISFDETFSFSYQYGIEKIDLSIHNIDLNIDSLYGINWKMGGKASWEQKGVSKNDMDMLKNEWIKKASDNNWILPKGYIGLFPCNSDNNDIIVYSLDDIDKEIARISFHPIIDKQKQQIFSVANCFLPKTSNKKDVIGLQIATAGNVMNVVDKFLKNKSSESAHLLQGLANRVAEDMAKILHKKLQNKVQKNTGARYSPGYPGLDLKNNKVIYDLIKADTIGIQLTKAYEFIPTCTTAAIVCFHPDAKY